MSQILSLLQKKLLSIPVDCIEIAYGGNKHPFDELINTDIEQTPISDMVNEKDFLLNATRSISEDWVVKEVVNGQNLIVRGFIFPDGAVSFLIADDYDVAVGLGVVDDGVLRFAAFKGVDSPVLSERFLSRQLVSGRNGLLMRLWMVLSTRNMAPSRSFSHRRTKFVI